VATPFDKMTVLELKGQLKQSGLPVSGKKAELIQRLKAHAEKQSPDASPTIDSNQLAEEKKLMFACKQCQAKLRIPLSFEGLVKCPNCEMTQAVSDLKPSSQTAFSSISNNQIAVGISITGLVLGIFAIFVALSAFTYEAMCAEEDRTTVEIDGEVYDSCDSEDFLWETTAASRLFNACCIMIPGSMLLTVVGYNMRKDDVKVLTEHQTGLSATEQANFSDTKAARFLQAAAVYFGVGIAAITTILILLVVIFLFIAIYALLDSGSFFA